MPVVQPISIREVLLAEIKAQEPRDFTGPTLQQTSILNAVARKLGVTQDRRDLEQAILTQWSELFRTGLLAWGLNLSNPNPPFFHLTERGRQALENVARDPSNPAGYLRHLSSVGHIDSIALSYLKESLDCYVAGLFKAAAKSQFARELRDGFESAWGAVTQQIRSTRNEVGHPSSIDPVTPDTVHASLLLFPELSKLTTGLRTWIINDLT